MGTFFLIIFTIFIIGIIINAVNAPVIERQKNNALKSAGVSADNLFIGGKFVGGHPNIDKEIKKVSLAVSPDNEILIFTDEEMKPLSLEGAIPVDKVKNIVIEDATTIEKRVTVARMLAVGLFAFAWKKKQKNEHSFLIIEWQDSRFEHETIFEFEGKGSVQLSNQVRNQLIRLIR